MDNNWTIEQTKQLFALAKQATDENRGLVWAFSQMAQTCGRSSNSVRNYYYSQLKMFELVPQIAKDLGITPTKGGRGEFELFSDDEINELLKTILVGKADGTSVRSVIASMCGGDAKKALRLQNKYRSMTAHHRDRVTAVMRELAAEGKQYYNPYLKRVETGEPTGNYEKLSDYISALSEEEAGEFLSLMKKLFA